MIEEIKNKALDEKVPIIKDDGLSFLLDLIKENRCKEILELGTAVGYSAMQMASLDADIHIDTIEKNEEMYKQAIANIKDNGLEGQIDVHFMPIEEYETNRKYDFIFVDAAKAQYHRYMDQFLDNLKADGLMVFDNMVFHGLIYEEEIKSRSLRSLVRKIKEFRDFVHNDERFDIMMYDHIGDGILVLRRRNK